MRRKGSLTFVAHQGIDLAPLSRAAVAARPAAGPSCAGIREDHRAFVAANNSCLTAADCRVHTTPILSDDPSGCLVYVNRSSSEPELSNQARSWAAACLTPPTFCSEPPLGVTCSEGRCVRGRGDAGDASSDAAPTTSEERRDR